MIFGSRLAGSSEDWSSARQKLTGAVIAARVSCPGGSSGSIGFPTVSRVGRCTCTSSMRLASPRLETMFGDLFGLKIDHPRIYRFKLMMASYYSETAKGILARLVSGNVIYVG